MKCNKCSQEIPDNSKFCLHCGTKVEVHDGVVCPKCGFKNPSDATFCTECGTRIHPTSQKKTECANKQRVEIDIAPTILNQQDLERQKELIQCRLTIKRLYLEHKLGYELFVKSCIIPSYSETMSFEECYIVIDNAQKIIDEDHKQKQIEKNEKLNMVENEIYRLNNLLNSNDADALFTPQEIYDRLLKIKSECQNVGVVLDYTLSDRISLLYRNACLRACCHKKFIKSRSQAREYISQFTSQTLSLSNDNNSLAFLGVDVISLHRCILRDFNAHMTFDDTLTYLKAVEKIFEGCKLNFEY